MRKRITPPFKPVVKSDDDCRNIDQMFLQESIKDTMPIMNMQSFASKQKNHFGNFTYISRQSNVANSAAVGINMSQSNMSNFDASHVINP